MTLQKRLSRRAPGSSSEGETAAYRGCVSDWTPPMIRPELAQEHHACGNGPRVQAFWAGTTFDEAGDASKLSYCLAKVRLQLLLERGSAGFGLFIAQAHYDDVGQTAALDCLGTNSGELAGTFRGPGKWHPVRQDMVACWKAQQAGASQLAVEAGTNDPVQPE